MVMASSCPTLPIHIDREFRGTTSSERPNCWRTAPQADCAASRLGPARGVPLIVHSLFDALAFLAALAVFRWVPVVAPGAPAQPWRTHAHYLAVGSLGVTAGAYLAGSANLWISGIDGLGRSIE